MNDYTRPCQGLARHDTLPSTMGRLVAILIWLTALGTSAAELGTPLIFSDMCDASAAVALDEDCFVAAGDEDNILRIYRLSQPGRPVSTFNLNPHFAGRKKSPEADIEGAARLGQRAIIITGFAPKSRPIRRGGKGYQ